MTTQNTNTTPELLNTVFIEGEVYSHDLEIKEIEPTVDGNKVKMTAIMGSVDVRTGDNEVHKIRLYSRSLTQKLESNKQYEGYVTLKNELVTVQQIAEKKNPEGVTEPTKVRAAKGQLGAMEFYNDAGQLKSFPQTQGRYLNRLKESDEFAPKAEYDVEGIVAGVANEIKNTEETGRVIVKLLVPTYNGAIEQEFVSRVEDADYIVNNFEPNMTVNLYGTIMNFSEKIVTTESAGFGEDKVVEKWNNVHELRIRGGKVYEYDEDVKGGKAFSPDQVKALIAKRNENLAKLKADAEAKKNGSKKSDGFGGGAPKTPTSGGSKPPVGNFF